MAARRELKRRREPSPGHSAMPALLPLAGGISPDPVVVSPGSPAIPSIFGVSNDDDGSWLLHHASIGSNGGDGAAQGGQLSTMAKPSPDEECDVPVRPLKQAVTSLDAYDYENVGCNQASRPSSPWDDQSPCDAVVTTCDGSACSDVLMPSLSFPDRIGRFASVSDGDIDVEAAAVSASTETPCSTPSPCTLPFVALARVFLYLPECERVIACLNKEFARDATYHEMVTLWVGKHGSRLMSNRSNDLTGLTSQARRSTWKGLYLSMRRKTLYHLAQGKSECHRVVHAFPARHVLLLLI